MNRPGWNIKLEDFLLYIHGWISSKEEEAMEEILRLFGA
jgi:hypothetical protein